MTKENHSYDWPGWPLKANPFGDEFDHKARERMVTGSEELLPLIRENTGGLGSTILEVGPFFHPLITPDRFPNAKIFYWENDRYVLQYLEQTYAQESVYPIFCDLNNIDGNSLLKLSSQTKMAFFDKLQKDKISFDSVVLSHVLNYIDYKFFLIILTWFLKKGGYLFLNNVIDYGLPAFFSEHRPKSKQEILDTLEQAGYVIIDQKTESFTDGAGKKRQRLLLVAKI